jgi:hypothetical protein
MLFQMTGNTPPDSTGSYNKDIFRAGASGTATLAVLSPVVGGRNRKGMNHSRFGFPTPNLVNASETCSGNQSRGSFDSQRLSLSM